MLIIMFSTMRKFILVTIAALLAAVSAYAGPDGFLKGKVLMPLERAKRGVRAAIDQLKRKVRG